MRRWTFARQPSALIIYGKWCADNLIPRITFCIYALCRFFYKHIWMAWDDDSNVYDWTKSHLMSRLHFYYDLKKKINPALVGHIEKLLIEATYLQQQKKMLENEVEKQETMQTNDNEDTAKSNAVYHFGIRFVHFFFFLLSLPRQPTRAEWPNWCAYICGWQSLRRKSNCWRIPKHDRYSRIWMANDSIVFEANILRLHWNHIRKLVSFHWHCLPLTFNCSI